MAAAVARDQQQARFPAGQSTLFTKDCEHRPMMSTASKTAAPTDGDLTIIQDASAKPSWSSFALTSPLR